MGRGADVGVERWSIVNQQIEIDAYCADDIRAAEAPVLAVVRDGALMDRAADALARVCAELMRRRRGGVYGRRAVLLVGTGNNGGDALLAGALLCRRGLNVTAVLFGDEAYARGLAKLRRAGGRFIDADDVGGPHDWAALLADADMIVDGIVGISGSVGLEPMVEVALAAINSETVVVAVDLPSGVDPDNGEVAGSHVRAHVTVTFGAFKPCLLLPPAAHVAGRIEFVSVGIEPGLPSTPAVRRLGPAGVAARWPVPQYAGHKYTRGVLGVVAGSDMYPGAAVLAAMGAARAGVGIIRFVGPQLVTDHVLRAVPEAVPGDGRVQAWLLGSGVENDRGQDAAIATALASGLPCVVDAGALSECARQRTGGSRATAADQLLLTPHAGELARVLGEIGHPVDRADVERRPSYFCRLAAELLDATVLLKGPTTLIGRSDGLIYSQNDGLPWLATAGSGDVLAGIAGALMASGKPAQDAGAMAAFVHGRAAIMASKGGPIVASDVAHAAQDVVADLLARYVQSAPI